MAYAECKEVDMESCDPKIVLIRVAVRFFSGVPHPHLLGVCYPDILIFSFGLTFELLFFTFSLPKRGRSSIG